MPTKTKECKGCGKTKPLSDFNRRKDSADGYRHRCKPCSETRPRKNPVNPPAQGGRLPVEPFRSWLEKRLAHYGSPKILAAVTGMNERQLHRVMSGESKKVALDTVDRALTYERSTALWELDYKEGDFVQAASEQANTDRKRK